MTENEPYTNIQRINSPEGCFELMHDANRWPQITQQQFSPSGYVDAQPVAGQGGRGGAWFVQTPVGPAVLKHYRRGGFLAKFVRSRYFFLGTMRTRAFQEFQLLQSLLLKGLPVAKPVAAFCKRGLFNYQAALVTERIANVHSLVIAAQLSDAPWQRIGEVIAMFHRAGAQHSDLNANNILINFSGDVFIIDWDKSKLKAAPGDWCETVLARLRRSLLKECAHCDVQQLQQGITQMINAYQKAMK